MAQFSDLSCDNLRSVCTNLDVFTLVAVLCVSKTLLTVVSEMRTTVEYSCLPPRVKKLNTNCIAYFATYFKNAKAAAFCGIPRTATLYALSGFTNLLTLNLAECVHLTDGAVVNFANRCRELNKLSMKNCHHVTDYGVRALAKSCPQLGSLNIRGCWKVTNTGVGELAKYCPYLSSLNIRYCDDVTTDVLEKLSSCPLLSSLSTTSIDTDTDMESICSGFTKLNQLSIESAFNVTDACLGKLVSSHPQLSSLTLRDCPELTDEGLKWLVNCSLTSLKISACKVTDELLGKLATGCPQLSVLKLSDYGSDYGVSDYGLGMIGEHCEHLSELYLCGCYKVTDLGLSKLIKCPLYSLSIAACYKVTDEGLCKLVEGRPQLSSLNLRDCRKITDRTLENIGKHCKDLSELDLFGCDKVTDAGIEKLANGCAELSSLDIVDCQNVTYHGITKLTESCRNLSTLDLSSKIMTDWHLDKMSNHCPRLRVRSYMGT